MACGKSAREREEKPPTRGKERKRNENRAEIKLGTKRLYFSDRLFGENGKCEPKNHPNAERERAGRHEKEMHNGNGTLWTEKRIESQQMFQHLCVKCGKVKTMCVSPVSLSFSVFPLSLSIVYMAIIDIRASS